MEPQAQGHQNGSKMKAVTILGAEDIDAAAETAAQQEENLSFGGPFEP